MASQKKIEGQHGFVSRPKKVQSRDLSPALPTPSLAVFYFLLERVRRSRLTPKTSAQNTLAGTPPTRSSSSAASIASSSGSSLIASSDGSGSPMPGPISSSSSSLRGLLRAGSFSSSSSSSSSSFSFSSPSRLGGGSGG